MGYLLLPGIPLMSGEGMVEGLPVDILRVLREVVANRRGKIDIGAIGHEEIIASQDLWFLTPVNPREWNGP